MCRPSGTRILRALSVMVRPRPSPAPRNTPVRLVLLVLLVLLVQAGVLGEFSTNAQFPFLDNVTLEAATLDTTAVRVCRRGGRGGTWLQGVVNFHVGRRGGA